MNRAGPCAGAARDGRRRSTSPGWHSARSPTSTRAIERFAGDDRFVVDYISEEFLDRSRRRELEVLQRAAVLDRLSGGLCDAVLAAPRLGDLLRELSRSNMLLTPLDRRDEWFRFHPLFREMLRAELRRVEPENEVGLQSARLGVVDREGGLGPGDQPRDRGRRAGPGGGAALDGDPGLHGPRPQRDRGRLARPPRRADGRHRCRAQPDRAYTHITQGAGDKTEHWAAIAAGLIEREPPSERRTVLDAGLGLIEAALARDGVEAIAERSALAAEMLPDDSAWMSMCRLIEGVGLHLSGLRPEAREKLVDGARRGAVSAPNVQVLCLSQLALLAIEEDDWTLAEMLASQARAQLDRSGIGDYPMMALAMAVSA